MKNTMTASVSIGINAGPDMIWKALTTPSLIKQYLMGTDVETDWKVGSPINYTGQYKGKQYHDKGVVKAVEKNKRLQTTYWSSMGGKPDNPENYNVVTYTIESGTNSSRLTLTQDNIADEKEKEQAIKNWEGVLQKLKQVVEEGVDF